jgi:hypothetical protein
MQYHLLRLKLNLMPLRCADDGAAKILIRARGSQADSGGVLRRDVAQVVAQLKVGQLTRSDGPARDDGQRQNGQSEDEFAFSHHDNPFQ